MPKWRKLHTKTVDSLDLNDMPDDFTRLLWMTLPLGLDLRGIGIDNCSWVKSRTMPLREDVTPQMVGAALDWYEKREMIERYEINGRRYFWIPTWHKYQGNTEREADSEFPPPDSYEPHEKRKTESKTEDDTNSGASQELVESKSGSDVDVDSDTEAEEETEAEIADADAPLPPDGLPDPSELTVKEIQALELGVEQWRGLQERERNGRNRSTALRFMRSQLNPIAPAVQVYRSLAETTPVNVICTKIAESVGANEDDLDFWREVVIGYIAKGWNKYNVSNMLDFYKRREMPSNGRASSGQRATKGLDASKEAIIQWAASHGTDLEATSGDT